jgi:hypothetical protein
MLCHYHFIMVMVSVIRMSVIILNVVMLNVILLSVVMLSVVAPCIKLKSEESNCSFLIGG